MCDQVVCTRVHSIDTIVIGVGVSDAIAPSVR